MDTGSPHRFSIPQIGVTLVIGSVALLMLGLQPILLGELVDRHFITLEGVGIVAMGEILALGVGVALSDALLPISRHRLITMIAALVAAVLDIATLRAASDRGFVAVRVASGLTEGVLLWAATSVIVRSASPERLAAIFMVVQTVAQAGVAALLAAVVVPRVSWQGGFEVLAALTGLCAIIAAWLPPSLAPLQTHAAEKLRWTASCVVPLVIAFLQMAALGSLWAYLEPLGKAAGLDARGAQFMTSVVLVMQVIGGIAATGSVRRFAVVPTLGIGSAVLTAVSGGIHFLPSGAESAFTLLCAVFGFAWLFLMPFQIALAFRADAKGRVALLIPAAQLVGSAIGPLVASLTVTEDDAHTVPLVSLGFALAAALLITAGRRLWATIDAPDVEVLRALEPRV
jgi:MFS transporter, DHA1 family, inner membrane transport protein